MISKRLALTAMTACLMAVTHATSAKVTLTWYVGFGSTGDITATKTMMKRFEAENPGIKVNIMQVAWNEAPHKFLTMTAAGKPPDVLSMGMSQWDIASKNCFVDLYPYIRAHKIDMSLYHEQSIEAYEYASGKKLYGFPFGVNALQLFYNRSIFDKAGLTYPTDDWEDKSWTWEAFLEVAKKITRDTNNDGKIDQYGINAAMGDWDTPWTFGGAWLNKEKTRVTADSPESLRGWQFNQDLIHKYKVTGSSLETGKAGMHFGGTWGLPTFRKINKFKWNVAPIPFGTNDPKNRMNHFYPDALVMASLRHREESWKLIKWITQNQANYRFFYWDIMGMMPTLKSERKYFIDKLKRAEDGINWEIIIDAPKYAQVQRMFLISEWGEFRDALPSGLADIWSGKKAPEQVLKSLVPKLQSIVERSKR